MESMQELEGQHEPVSIVGMGCRWAGGVTSPTGLWELLRNNKDGWRKFDAPRFSAEGFHHPNQDRPGSLRTEGGFLVEEDARLFDNAFFGITAREVETMDPSQRKLLEVVYEAFENGGETWESISNSRTGVYIGSNSLDHTLIQARDWESPRSYAATGADASLLANRISYIFNLHGPSLAMNTACSSSMYALHMAVSAIRNGDCDGAIVAAANWVTDPSMQSVLDKLGALSPTSRCHTFDASADGYARGEGFAAIYLKKSSIAVLEKMPIRAMIRGTAINANGRTGGITRSSTEGQEDVIRRAYENSGNLPFSDTAFFECHGTGTQAGDPIEVEAIGNVFASSRSKARKDRLLIGSVKPSLGHTEGASAIASIMKVVLSLEAGEVPPTFGVKDLNTHIDFEKARVEVVRDHTAQWPEGKLRRASINSFGFGGANGHCVIDHVNVVLPGYTKPGILARPAAAARSATQPAIPIKPINPPSSPPRPSGIPKLQRSATIGTPMASAINLHSTNGQANGQTNANSSGSSNPPPIGRQSSISRMSRRKSRVLTKTDKSDKFETQSVSDKKKTASMDWVTSKLGSMFHSSNTNSARPGTSGPNGASLNGDYFGSAALTSPAPVTGNSGMSSLTCPVRYNTGGPQKAMKADATTRQLVLLPFSAHNASSLKLNIEALSATSSRWPLADVAYTLGCKRSRLQQRTFRVVDKDDVASGLALEQRVFTSPDHPSNLAFVFSGQGTQWHAMGAELFQYAAFRTVIAYLDQVLHAHAHPGRTSTTMWRIANVLSGACEPDCVQSPAVSQVVCTAVQIGLVDLLASWGVRPVAVVGHSAGEMAAAYASGRITAAEAITAAYFHGQAVAKNRKKGAMLAVGLGAGQVASYLEGWEEQVQAAALNSPASVALSGDEDAIMALSNKLTEDGVFNRVLSTAGNAYHSRHMKALGNDYSAILLDGIDRIRKLGLLNPANRYRPVPWVSSVTPHKTMASDGQNLTAAYWRANLESPVRFTEAVTNMMALPLAGEKTIDVLIEIGPHPTLKGPLEQILKSAGKLVPYASTLQRNTRGMESVLSLAGTLFSLNAEIDMAAVNAMDEEPGRLSHGCTAIDLPKYQFSYGPVSYYESRPSKEFRLRKVLRHDLLGSKLPGTSKLQPQWRNMLRIKDVPWLTDHRLIPDVVLPASGFIAMAIEAATRVYQEIPDALQITGFSLRKLDIETALRLPEDDSGIEVMFSMTQLEGSTAKSPAWASFAISSVSRDSSEWTEHCTGTIRVDVAEPDAIEAMSTEMDARHPETRAWYNKFNEIGLGYGSTFQPLSDLRVDPYRGLALANIKLNSSEGTMEGESKYLIHPAALDGAFQLGLIACYGGQVEKASTAFVPVHLSQMYVNAGLGRETAVAVAQGKIQGLRGAYIDLQLMDKGGRVALHVERLRCLGFKESKKSAKEIEAKKPFCSPFTRVAWKPDIRKLNNRQMRDLFPPPSENKAGGAKLEAIDMICCLVAMDIYDRFVRGGEGPQPNGELQHWVAWLKHCGEEDQRPNMVHARKLSPEERHQLLGKLSEEVGDKPEVEAAKRLHKNIGDILTGHNSGIDVLVPGGLLNSLYDVGHVISGAFPQLANVMDCLGHTNPSMRVLEIGAGTGSATRVTMGALHGPNGIKRYGSYTFTDTSAGFLTSAQQGFMSGYRDVNYAVLDIEQDPLENGFEPVYDVVVACETIHATQSMDKTLAHCHRLLKPGGKLVLVENTRMRVLLTFLYGTLAGYWLGTEDGRTEGPFMNQETWDSFLRKAGFSGAELVLDDYERPTNTTSVIVSTKIADSVEQAGPVKDMNDMDGLVTPATNGVVHLLLGTDRVQPQLLKTVAEEFEHRGIATKTTLLEDVLETVPAGARVVAFLCTEDNLLLGDEQRLKAFQYLAKTAESMVWLTSSGMVKGRNAVAGFMVGLMRTIATENPTGRFLSIDIDAENFEFAEADDADEQRFDLARSVVDQEISLYREGSLADDGEPKDRELAWQDGCMWVSRVVPDTGLGAYAEPIKTPSGCGYDMVSLGKLGPVRAAFETPGNLNSLYFRAYTEMMQPIPADHIEVRVRAVGLNWKDLGLSSGRFDADGSNLSSEYAGSITRVGSAVTNLAVGDRVYGIGRGHFGNFTCVPAAFAQKLRPTDKSVEMATMPLVYATAVYAFQYVARIRKGHKVLIQSATGGLGLAAIQVAQSKGGEIYCTVSSSEKKKFLVENGIPEDHIFSSRDTKALLRAAKQCGAKGGFDVILSTAVGGDSLHQAFKALAPMGHLVDVGRLDVLGSKELGLELFQKNANFSSFDLNLVLDNDPELGGELMEAVNDLYQVGFITPIHPVTCSDIADLDKTLVGFAKGVHIGKLVVSFQNPKSQVKVVREPKSMVFRPDARYVITGGLGGLGRGIIRWMVDRGARDFTVLSRRGLTTPEAHLLVKDLEARGVRIDCIMCDVSNREDALKAVSESSGQPIKGVVHAAMSLTDLTFDKLTIDQWRDGFSAKALGTVNLHEAVESLPLDFFVMVTSTESIWAPPAQAAYVAANNFQDYFARYRRNLGLPASTVSYGLVADVSSDFRDQTVGIEDMYARNRAMVISEHQLLAQLEPAFLYSVPYKTVTSQWIGKHTDPLSAANLYTCMDPAALAKLGTAGSAPPRWYGDGRVALIMRAMEDSQRAAANGAETLQGAAKSAVAQLRDAFDQGVSAGPSNRAKTVELVVNGIVRTVTDMLVIDVANVNPAKSVAEHGIDSLLAAELKSWFGQALRANVSVERLLDAGVSIRGLAEEVVDRGLKG